MKHLLNNISQEDKNRILEQHRGGKSIDTTRFKVLLESTMGNVKPLIIKENESEVGLNKEGKCMNTKKSAQTVGNGSDANIVYDLSIVAPKTLQDKIKNARSNTGFFLRQRSDGYTMYAERFWDWSDIKGSLSSVMQGEKLGQLQPGPKFKKIEYSFDNANIEWKYENGKVTFYFYETHGC